MLALLTTTAKTAVMLMAAAPVAQRLRTAAALHVTGCITVAVGCVMLGCSSGRSVQDGASRTMRVWDAGPKTITDYWRLHYNIKMACLSASENA